MLDKKCYLVQLSELVFNCSSIFIVWLIFYFILYFYLYLRLLFFSFISKLIRFVFDFYFISFIFFYHLIFLSFLQSYHVNSCKTSCFHSISCLPIICSYSSVPLCTICVSYITLAWTLAMVAHFVIWNRKIKSFETRCILKKNFLYLKRYFSVCCVLHQ